MMMKRPKPTVLTKTIRVLSPVLKPRVPDFTLGLVLVLCSTACEILAPYLLGKGTDIVIGQGAQNPKLVKISLAFLAVISARALTEAVQGWVIQKSGQKVIHDLRLLVFEKIHGLAVPYFDSHPTGRILTRVINDIKAVSELFTASISVLVLDVTIIIGSLISMFWMNPALASIVLVTFPLVFWTVWNFGEKLSEAYKKVRNRLSEVNAFLGENIAAVATIQTLNAEKYRTQTFDAIVYEHTQAQMKALKVYASVQPFANILNGFAMASLMWVGGVWAINGKITLGVLVAFFAYLRNLFQPIRDLVEKYNTFLTAMVAAERIVAVLDEKSESSDDLSTNSTDEKLTNTQIEFKNISFKYPARDSLALDDVSFSIEHGKSLAIVGATGSGKSTLIRLLLRFYQPSAGKIYLGGKELSQFDRKTLRRHLGVIQQEVYLFSGTIRANLTLGKKGISDSYLEEECRRTHLWNWIENRGGLDLMVFEGGSNLSLGERQLLACTRTRVFQPDVLILDEATASVDPISEKYLMSAIQEGLKGMTSIVIAHRLSTIKACDLIIVMSHGRIAEQGTYESLLRKKGLFFEFHQIYSLQGQRRASQS